MQWSSSVQVLTVGVGSLMKFHYFVCDKNPVSNEQDAYLCSEEAPLFREIEPMLPSAVQIVLFHSLLLHWLLLPEDVVHIEHYLQQGLSIYCL